MSGNETVTRTYRRLVSRFGGRETLLGVAQNHCEGGVTVSSTCHLPLRGKDERRWYFFMRCLLEHEVTLHYTGPGPAVDGSMRKTDYFLKRYMTGCPI